MARQLTPLGRFLVVLAGLALVGYALYRYGVLDRLGGLVAPDKRQEGTVSKDDFGGTTTAGTTPTADRGAAGSAPLEGGSRLKRPIKVAIVTWGGYAGGIVANDGFAPNKDCLF